MNERKCVIQDCTDVAEGFICAAHWGPLPLMMRHRFWRETQYGMKAPDENLVHDLQVIFSAEVLK